MIKNDALAAFIRRNSGVLVRASDLPHPLVSTLLTKVERGQQSRRWSMRRRFHRLLVWQIDLNAGLRRD